VEPAALFQSVSDPSRLRLLRLLQGRELNVQELVRITGLSQPSVSKHLALLRDQGWLSQRREGTWSWHRAVRPAEFPGGQDLFDQILRAAEGVAEASADDQGLAAVLAEREERDRDFFAGIADRWDDLRGQFEHPDIGLHALAALVAPGLAILDIGTGTGAMLPVFSAAAGRVVALDNSEAMLARARTLCRQARLDNVEFCLADVGDIPFPDGSFDACNCSMVLHHVEDPAAALGEIARVVRPRGTVLVTAFRRHDLTWMRDELAHRRLGFARDEIEDLFRGAGLRPTSWLERGRRDEPAGNGGAAGRIAWPDVFLAVGAKTPGA